MRNFTVREVRPSTRERCVWGFAGQETDSKINGSPLPRTLFEVRLGRSNERWTITNLSHSLDIRNEISESYINRNRNSLSDGGAEKRKLLLVLRPSKSSTVLKF
jgi:hypothetical protein